MSDSSSSSCSQSGRSSRSQHRTVQRQSKGNCGMNWCIHVVGGRSRRWSLPICGWTSTITYIAGWLLLERCGAYTSNIAKQLEPPYVGKLLPEGTQLLRLLCTKLLSFNPSDMVDYKVTKNDVIIPNNH